MKLKFKLLSIVIIEILLVTGISAQVGIGTSNPNASAGLDVDFTNKGFLPPRMTTVQRNAIINPQNGLMIFNLTTGKINCFFENSWYEMSQTISPSGVVATLDCANAIITGTLTATEPANGVSGTIPYSGGNGQYYEAQLVNSTGVTGLSANLNSGVFNNGSGDITYTITGTPASTGTANFAINLGGQSCVLVITVNAPSFICGTSTVTFTYNGASVTYGTVISGNSRCWLDRNLGASNVAQSATQSTAYGHLFQWGRLDDSHQVRTSSTTTTLSNVNNPGHDDFILAQYSPYDWRSPQNNDLWQGVSGINNPCPQGFRLPSKAEWETEKASWSSSNIAGAFTSPLKITLNGCRIFFDGSISEAGNIGYYWSSTVNGTNSEYLYVDYYNAYLSPIYRAMGHAVRCIKD